MELDQEAIFERLIFDVYDKPDAFIRELLQNALDATRCKMYADYQAQKLELPETPTKFPEEVRSRYQIRFELKEIESINELSGEREKRQVLFVEDNGIGMDREVIQKYFLQVGRSFYVTNEFRRIFSFNPTSRFGVGFLSVFAVSDFVEVETLKPESHDGPLRITLTGPRNYILIEKIERQVSGTRIGVTLRQMFYPGQLTNALQVWCKRVEFPVEVDDLGKKSKIVAESSKDFVYEMPVVTDPNARFALRCFPIDQHGMEGELYVLALINNSGESWAMMGWAESEYPNLHPSAYSPELPRSMMCINGIQYEGEIETFNRLRGSGFIERIDYRGLIEHLKLSRKDILSWQFELRKEIDSFWKEIIENHLKNTRFAKGDDGWIYKQRLLKEFASYGPIPFFWKDLPETIGIFLRGKRKKISSKEIEDESLITLAIITDWRINHLYRQAVPEWDSNAISIWVEDLRKMQDTIKQRIFSKRRVTNMRWLNKGYLAMDFIKIDKFDEKEYLQGKQLVSFPDRYTIYYEVEIKKHNDGFFNKRHHFIRYLIKLRDACGDKKYNLNEVHFKKLASLTMVESWKIQDDIDKLENYLNEMRNMPNLPGELKPPKIDFTKEMFQLIPPDSEEMVSTRRKVKIRKSKREKEI